MPKYFKRRILNPEINITIMQESIYFSSSKLLYLKIKDKWIIGSFHVFLM